MIKQATLIGVLYLENNLTPHVFTPARIAVLKLLASQAAISLENTRLYSDLQEREAKIRRLVDSNIIGILISDLGGGILEANDAFLEMVGYSRDDLVSGRVQWLEMTPAEWLAVSQRAVAQLRATGSCEPFEKEYFRKDGSRVPVLVGAAAFERGRDESVAFVLDLTERKRAEEQLREVAGRLITAQEEERHRIGRELHDHISQRFAVLAIRLDQAAGPASASAGLEELAQETRDIAEDIHHLSHRLHSTMLDYLGLVPALQRLVAEFSERHRLTIDFTPGPLPAAVSPDVSLCLFRIVEEALTNVAKHSRAQSVRVSVVGAPGGVRVTVDDDGAGFDPKMVDRGGGLGLMSMRERVRLVHGTLNVESGPSQGTRIDAWAPVTSAGS